MDSSETPGVRLMVRRLPEFGDDIPLPAHASDGAAAFDLRAAIPHHRVHVIEPGARDVIDTGLMVAIPPRHELQIRPRSGLALRHGITVLNSPGTVDSDYRGHLRVILVNLGQSPFEIRRGDRIAQAVLAPVVRAEIVEVAELDATSRGAGGFGSTGSR